MSRIAEYIRARTPDEAMEAKHRFGPSAFYLAGGTDALVFPSGGTTAIDIMHTGLDHVQTDAGVLRIGATAIMSDIEKVPAVRSAAGGALLEAIRETGPWLIRNAATLAGNICNASPSADSVPMLMALEGELVLSGERAVPLDDVFTGPHRTTLGDELVVEIRLRPGKRSGYFRKHSRSKSDVAQVNVAITGIVEDGHLREPRVVLGSVAPTPLRARETEQLLGSHPINEALLDEVARTVRAEIAPIDDWRASSGYRRHVAGVLVRRGVEWIMGREGRA